MKLRYAVQRWLLLALLATPLLIRAQTPGVGIGTTAPDASAALDIVSSSKGALLPRVASAAAIASPATGLIVYQTGAPAGFYYNAGTPTAPSWQQLATASGAVVTAGSGLTKTGQTIALGGALSQNTSLDLNGNSLDVNGAVVAQQIVQLTATTTSSTTTPGGWGQSFQLPAGATVRQVDVYGAGSGTFRLFSGGPAGLPLATQAVSYTPNQGLTSVVLTTPVTVGAAGTYLFQTGSTGAFAVASNNPYPGGVLFAGTLPLGGDLKFAVYYTLAPSSALYVSGGGGVGLGTTAPTATLDVAGSTRLRGLGAGGYVTTDAQGNLSSASGGGSFVLNQGATDQAGEFRLTGLGRAGALLATGHPAIGAPGTHLQWNRSATDGETWLLNQKGGGNADAGIRFGKSDQSDNTSEFGRFIDNGFFGLGDFTNAGGNPLTRLSITPGTTETKITLFDAGNIANHYGFGVSSNQLNYHVFSNADRHVFYAGGKNGDGAELLRVQGDGRVGIGTSGAATALLDVNGSTRLRGLGAGVVSADASGNLSSAPATTTFGNSFIQNQTSFTQAGGFRVGGTGAVLGNLGVGTATPSTPLDLGPGFGSSATDAATKKLAVYNNAAGTDFYGLGVSGGYLHLFAGAAATAAPALSISNGGNVGVGTAAPRGRLDVSGGDSYLVTDPTNGGSQNAYLPGALWLAPYNGTSGTAYVQARVPSPGSNTSIGLTLRTTSAGTLLDALQLRENGKVVIPVLGGNGTRVVTADNSGALDASTAASLDATTASNGLKELGNDVRLGGDLSQATTINLAGNSFSLSGGATGQSAGQEAYTPAIPNNSGLTTSVQGQSFTLPTAATATAITVYNSATVNGTGTVTLRLFAGNGSSPTYSQTVQAASGMSRYVLTTPQALPAGVSRFEFVNGSNMNTVYMYATGNGYAGGDLYSNGAVYYFQSADNLEGHRDAYFVVDYIISSSAPTLYAAPNGRVGVGTSSPGHPLTVQADGSANSALLGLSDNFGTDKYNFSLSGGGLNLSESNVAGGRLFVQASSGNVGIGTTVPAYKLDVNGMIRGANVSPSDRRLKQDLRPLGATLAQLLQLHGARYRWNALGVARGGEAGREQIGLIAQEVEALYPELVSTDNEGYKAVNYAQLAPVLLEAIRELKADNDALRADAATDRAARQQQQQQAAADHADLQTLKQQLARLLGEPAPTGTQARR